MTHFASTLHLHITFQSRQVLRCIYMNPFLLALFAFKFWCTLKKRQIVISTLTVKSYFSHLLCAVTARNALLEKQNTLFYVNTFKTTCYLGGSNISNALNLEKLLVKIHN